MNDSKRFSRRTAALLRRLPSYLSILLIVLATGSVKAAPDSLGAVRLKEAIEFLNQITGTYALESQLDIGSGESSEEELNKKRLDGQYIRVFITDAESYGRSREAIHLSIQNIDHAKLVVEVVTNHRYEYHAEVETIESFELTNLRLNQQSLEPQWPNESPLDKRGKELRTQDRLILNPKQNRLTFASTLSAVGKHGADARNDRLRGFEFAGSTVKIEDQARYLKKNLSVLSRWGHAIGVRGEPQWQEYHKANKRITEGTKIDTHILSVVDIAARDGIEVGRTQVGSSQKYIGLKPLTHPGLPGWTPEEIYSYLDEKARRDIQQNAKAFQLESFIDDFISRFHREMGLYEVKLGAGSIRTVYDGEAGILGRLMPGSVLALESRFPQLHWMGEMEAELRQTLKASGVSASSVEMELLITESLFFAIRLQASQSAPLKLGGTPSKQLMLARLHLEVLAAGLERLGLEKSIPVFSHQLLSLSQELLPVKMQAVVQELRNYRASYKYHRAKKLLSNGLDIYTAERGHPQTPRVFQCRQLF